MPRPEHSEAYWTAIKYVILALTGLMIVALVLALVIVLRLVPWS
jgi:hypothetical protein